MKALERVASIPAPMIMSVVCAPYANKKAHIVMEWRHIVLHHPSSHLQARNKHRRKKTMQTMQPKSNANIPTTRTCYSNQYYLWLPLVNHPSTHQPLSPTNCILTCNIALLESDWVALVKRLRSAARRVDEPRGPWFSERHRDESLEPVSYWRSLRSMGRSSCWYQPWLTWILMVIVM